jgi:hypothetical protein
MPHSKAHKQRHNKLRNDKKKARAWIELLSTSKNIENLSTHFFSRQEKLEFYTMDIYLNRLRYNIHHTGETIDASGLSIYFLDDIYAMEFWIQLKDCSMYRINVELCHFKDPMALNKDAINFVYNSHIYYYTQYKPEKVDILRDTIHAWILETVAKELCRRQTEAIKEELVAEVWKPSRVEKWLEAGWMDY